MHKKGYKYIKQYLTSKGFLKIHSMSKVENKNQKTE